MSTIHDLFEQQVYNRPDAVAVFSGEERISYRELDRRAQDVSRHLIRRHSTGPGVLVALVMNRSEHFLSSFLGVLRSGAAYVPIEPSLPDARIAFIIKDAAATVVLTDSETRARVQRVISASGIDCAVVLIDQPFHNDRDAELAPKAQPVALGSDLAYVIYTSGSTGTPKGVGIEHHSVVNYIRNVRNHIGLGPDDVCDFSTSIGFDLTVTNTLGSLCLGGAVAVYKDALQNVPSYKTHLIRSRATVLKLTPGYFALIASSLAETQVKKVILGGEKLTKQVLEQIQIGVDSPLEVFDEYGPTEATVGACYSRVFPIPESPLDIGRFYDGYYGYVLGSDGTLLGPGIVGELYIGGEGVARGYIGQSEVSAERFIKDSFHNGIPGSPAARLYRTGDLVEWLAEGRLRYIGRADDQIKVRGYRIEPAEIENALRGNLDVADAAVIVTGSAESRNLTAYVVPGEFGCSSEELTAFLRTLLPEYMIPTSYVILESFPLTPNGKVDRSALAEISPAANTAYVAPQTELQAEIGKIWAEVLHIGNHQIGIHDEFVALGGDSILAIQCLSRLRQRLGIKVTVNELFVQNTIFKLCSYLEMRKASEEPRTEYPCMAAASGCAHLPLLPIQKWFLEGGVNSPDHFNQAFVIRTPVLDIHRLAASIASLWHHHPAFRLRYRIGEDGATQFYDATAEPSALKTLDIRHLKPHERSADFADPVSALFTAWQSSFDLTAGPIESFGYVYGFGDGSARIHIAVHHLAVDTISWRILAEDLQDLYQGTALPPQRSDYGEWSRAVAKYESGHADERDFWRSIRDRFTGTSDPLLEFLSPSEGTATYSEIHFSTADTARLLRDCQRPYNTQINDILLTAFATALGDAANIGNVCVTLEGHGREGIDAAVDCSRVVGWFTTLFPVYLEIKENLQATLVWIKERLRRIPNRGIGYGAIFGYGADALPLINFNYLGQFNPSVVADGSNWEIVNEYAGLQVGDSNSDCNYLSVVGFVMEGQLTFRFTSKLTAECTARLTSSFRGSLERLIADLCALDRVFLTPSDTGLLLSAPVLDELQRDGEIESVFRANSLQQGFIHHALAKQPCDDAYIVQKIWTYEDEIDVCRLEQAWTTAQKWFPALRLRFDWREEPVQVIDRRGTLDWRYIDLSDRCIGEQNSEFERILQFDRGRPFELRFGPLFRIYLIKRASRRYSCLFSSHHAILDGWSNTLLLNFVHDWYAGIDVGLGYAAGEGYVQVQRYLAVHYADDEEYWRSRVAAYTERMNLQGLLKSTVKGAGINLGEYRWTPESRENRFSISGDRRASLRRFAQVCGVTLNALALYCWQKCLHIFSGSAQTITGVVVSGRTLPVPGIDRAVGLFINTLPLIVNHLDDEPLLEALNTIQDGINLLNDRCVVDLAGLSGRASRLFDTLFIYENWPTVHPEGWQAKLHVAFEPDAERLDYPLSAVVREDADGLSIRLIYASELIDPAYVAEMALVWENLLVQLADDPPGRWSEMSLLPSEDAARLAMLLTAPEPDLQRSDVFHELFLRQARANPDRPALICGDVSMSYGELSSRASQLATMLHTQFDLRSEEGVIISLDRSIELIVAVLAVMQAGGAYIPIDPQSPAGRTAFILEDTAARVVLTQHRYRTNFQRWLGGNAGRRVLELDTLHLGIPLSAPPISTIPNQVRSSNLAYILYTSGTTGVPKGVMVEHASFCLAAEAIRERFFPTRERLNTFSLTNPVFDIFGLEYALPLLTGGCVQLGVAIPDSLSCRNLDFLQVTPSVLDLLLDRLGDTDDTLVICGGERLSSELLGRVLNRGIDLAHVYGPTETTIWSTGRLYPRSTRLDTGCVDLGRPFASERVFVLDSTRRPLPIGAPGELYIGGGGLARGYLNQPDQTRMRFIEEPFGPGSPRIYRTGDLVRVLPHGELEFLGRNDFQIKIHGHRVELNEVEAAIGAIAGIRQCVAVLRQNTIVGYYVASGELDPVALSAHLRSFLPHYMLPATLVRLDEMPLNAAGKIDRAALPAPAESVATSPTEPRTALERSARAVWARCLGLEEAQVGLDSDFYLLGGDSIRSIKVCSELHRQLDIDVRVSYLREHRTIRRFIEGIEGEAREGEVIQPVAVSSDEDQILSFAQERLWFAHALSRGSAAYNVPMILRVHDRVNLALLRISICDLIERHEVLRTSFRESGDGSIYQIVDRASAANIDLEPVEIANEEKLQSALRGNAQRAFDLLHEHPFRVRLYQLRHSGERLLAIVVHHVAFDGWSIDIFLRDLLALYAYHERRSGRSAAFLDLPPLPVRYRDYALWERDFVTENRISEHLGFWKNYLADFEVLRLPTDYRRPDVPDYHGAHHRFLVDSQTSSALHTLAAKLGAGLFSVLLSAYYVTLRSYCYQNDVIVGTPFANRWPRHSENLIGVFVNSLPLRKRVDAAALVCNFIREVAADTAAAQLHQQVPFEMLVQSLDQAQDRSRHPIFQVLFDVQGFGRDYSDVEAPLSLAAKAWEFSSFAKHDLSVFINDSREGLYVFVNYATSLFSEETVAAFADTYREVLSQFAGLADDEQARQQLRITHLRLLSDESYREMVEACSDRLALPESTATICGMFEEQAAKFPDSVALVCGEAQLTYSELNTRANRLAHQLIRSKVADGVPTIALCLERSEQRIVAILAVLKAGAAYVPMEPEEPDSRLRFIIDDCGTDLILTDQRHADRLKRIVLQIRGAEPCPKRVLAIDTIDLVQEPGGNPHPEIRCESPAYIIYTSGSSGRPKGVMQIHKNVVRLFEATNQICQVGSSDVWPLFHSYAFDFSVWEIWGALLHGGCLVMPTHDEVRDPERFCELCRRTGVTVLNQTPAAFSAFMEAALAQTQTRLHTLRYIFIGGEQWDVGIVMRWFENFGATNPLLVHVYGPTEATVFATMQAFTWNRCVLDSSLGPMLPNMSGYVVDPELRLLPVGAIGELCLGGTGIATGYVNRDDLTREVFLRNPFQSARDRLDLSESSEGKNSRIYRTGDLVRQMADRRLKFIGRNDSQVKLHGRRIELGEIESAVLEFRGVRQCAALIRVDEQSADSYLAAYYVAASSVDEASLREHLASILPSYMVPSALIMLDRMPLDGSGKIDRRSFPAPRALSSGEFVAPRTPQESRIRQVMGELLGVDENRISVEQDFFGLGGNSIKSIRLVSRINREFGANINIVALFRSPSVAGLAKAVASSARSAPGIVRYRPADPEQQVLSYAQERLWFVDQYERGTSAYNIGLVYELVTDVNLDALAQSVRAVYARHEPLRTVIRHGASGGYQCVLDPALHPVEIIRRHLTTEQNLNTALGDDVEVVFNLANEAPFRVCIYEVGLSLYLSFVIHHIAFDGWSVEILLSDLEEFYRRYSLPGVGAVTGPELSVQYRDFAAWERTQLSGEAAERLAAYWKGRLKGHEPLNLPTNRRRPQTTCYLGENATFELTEEVTTGVKALAAALKVSLFSVLLAAYYLFLRTYSRQDKLIVGAPVANRTHGEVDHLIGCFLNTLPLDFQVVGDERIIELIRRVAERVAEGQEHQQLSFERLVAELALPVDPSRHPVFQVTFDVNSFAKAHFVGAKAGTLLRYFQPEIMSRYSAKFDLSAAIDDSGARLKGTFTYASSLFDRVAVEGFITTYCLILQQFAHKDGFDRQTDIRVSDLELVPAAQADEILHRWGEGPRTPRSGLTVLDLFEEKARTIPDQVAVIFGDRSLTYWELDQRANSLARSLRSAGIGADDLVPLCIERSELPIIAILAVWKAGGAYVPVDPEFPDGRIAYILNDTAAKVVLCNQTFQERCRRLPSSHSPLVIAVDDPYGRFQPITGTNDLSACRPSATDLAYVIYTSGTMGEPKGVMIEHGSLANLHIDQTARYRIGEGNVREVILQVSNYIFDASVEQFVLALPNGHVLLLVPNRLWLDTKKFRHYLLRNRVTHISATPTFLNEFKTGRLPQLRRYVVGGEALDSACYQAIVSANDAEVFNQYGPTEITVTAVGECIRDGDISIGRPMANVKVFVLSPDFKPVPPEALGELYITGIGVARGYLNKSGMTTQSFLPNPFQTDEDKREVTFGPDGRYSRMYRTGDLVRWRRDGRIDYVGRTDQQVKIRGFRIELNEVNTVLSTYPGVIRSVVVIRQMLADKLVAYYTSVAPLDEGAILRHLKSALPDYMVPAFLVRVAAMPMTQHGKLDMSALPAPRIARWVQSAKPVDGTQTILRRIWAKVLSVAEDDIGIDNDFFEVGGNSILAIRLVGGLKAETNRDFAIADTFVHRTIRSQAAALLRAAHEGITILNSAVDRPCLFMVHPAHAGSEVYGALAARLERNFQCIGIESHNLRNAEKIELLPELAAAYVSRLDEFLRNQQQKKIRLFGWSLGGQIALEMASALEARGVSGIEVCVVDTVLPDDRLLLLSGTPASQAASYRERLQRVELDAAYATAVLANFETDRKLSVQTLSRPLADTRVLLIKATCLQDHAGAEELKLHEYVTSLRCNNIDLVHQTPSRIRTITVSDAHHFNVLQQWDEIEQALCRELSLDNEDACKLGAGSNHQ